jgi:hypothetical protein
MITVSCKGAVYVLRRRVKNATVAEANIRLSVGEKLDQTNCLEKTV